MLNDREHGPVHILEVSMNDVTLTWIASISTTLLIFLFLLFRPSLKRWYRKVRRRRGGVYLWRVRHHRNPMRRVTGYVGETVSFFFRGKQHLGYSRFAPTGEVVSQGTRVPAQPWSDLDPVMHQVIKLPWWLCWKWVLRPLETLVILCTWPIYNDAKNHWNPRRIPKELAKRQRRNRDALGSVQVFRTRSGVWARGIIQVAGATAVIIGTYGWLVTR